MSTTSPINIVKAYTAIDPVWIRTTWVDPPAASAAAQFGMQSISVSSPTCQP